MRYLFFILALAFAPTAIAQTPPRAFDPQVEAAARDVGKSLRCVVCQNQSIEESNAPLAADMRNLVRERLAAGQTRDQVIAYMTDRYGNFVLMQPPFQTDTLLLWLAPVALLLGGAWGWFAYLGPAAGRNLEPTPLSDDEATELSKTLGKGGTM
ncbi:MAG: cytochrome c-type biogenesis protein [Hyphomonadaceae bacterium]